MVKFEQARKIVLENIKVLEAENRPLLQSLGYVLAQDIYAEINIPPFDNSAMDGYALIAEDTKGASQGNPVTLNLIEDIPAGHLPSKTITHGEAAQIMTGALIPAGADAVIMVEYTQRHQDKVKILRQVQAGENIRHTGEDIKAGDLVLRKGTVIRPAEIGLLASLGKSYIPCIRRPKVAIITTGDELVDLNEELAPGKIRDTNLYSLAAQVAEAGGIICSLKRAPDNPEKVKEAIKEALPEADAFITSGGVSVGEHDIVKAVLKELGEILFWRVAMSPGSPSVFGVIEGKPIFGLPGNVAASMVSFEELARPAFLKMSGRSNLSRPEVKTTITHHYKTKKGTTKFLRAKTFLKEEKYFTEIVGSQKAGIISSMVSANSLAVVPEEVEFLESGEQVTAQLLEG